MEEEGISKRGRGRGRGARARGRGRGRGRGRTKKMAVVVSSEEEVSLDHSFDGSTAIVLDDGDVLTGTTASSLLETAEDSIVNDLPKDVDMVECPVSITNVGNNQIMESGAVANAQPSASAVQTNNIVSQTIDMEADISQLEAPTFTTICRGPPEPMLRLKWNHKVSLIGEKVLNPMIHICDQCDKPILHYGRMIPCKHVFCLKCARTEPVKVCPRCNDKVVRVEQSGLGTVFMCTHSGSRYGNTGCRRTYLSQRDLQAHINHRHVTQPPPPLPPAPIPPSADMKLDSGMQRKLSESSASVAPIHTASGLLTQRAPLRSSSNIGSIAPPGTATLQPNSTHSSLTQANLARINSANAQDCHQGKVALHQSLKKAPLSQGHHQPSESVADASYYSSVLNSFGSSGGSGACTSSNAPYESSSGTTSNQTGAQNSWQPQQYYR